MRETQQKWNMKTLPPSAHADNNSKWLSKKYFTQFNNSKKNLLSEKCREIALAFLQHVFIICYDKNEGFSHFRSYPLSLRRARARLSKSARRPKTHIHDTFLKGFPTLFTARAFSYFCRLYFLRHSMVMFCRCRLASNSQCCECSFLMRPEIWWKKFFWQKIAKKYLENIIFHFYTDVYALAGWMRRTAMNMRIFIFFDIVILIHRQPERSGTGRRTLKA